MGVKTLEIRLYQIFSTYIFLDFPFIIKFFQTVVLLGHNDFLNDWKQEVDFSLSWTSFWKYLDNLYFRASLTQVSREPYLLTLYLKKKFTSKFRYYHLKCSQRKDNWNNIKYTLYLKIYFIQIGNTRENETELLHLEIIFRGVS